jgi:hypothetical protein
MAVPIALRQDFDGPGLRRLAKQSRDAAQARRLLALAEIYDGGSRTDAARIGGVSLQIVRDWVLRFNKHGSQRAHQPQGAWQPPQAERGATPGSGQNGGERSDPGHPWRGALATQGPGALAL